MEKEDKKKIILYTVGGILTANAVKDVYLGIKDASIKGKRDFSDENTIGYENINTRFNTKVHTNNFVVLRVKRGSLNDITALTDKLNKCRNENISVSLVLDSNSCTLGDLYSDIDYLESILKKFEIDMPVYFNIDSIMNNKSLNNAMKRELISAFVDKMNDSSFRIGFYGTDTNLTDLHNYILDIGDKSIFLVKDNDETIKYNGKTDIIKFTNGEIIASHDLSEIVDSNIKLSYSVKYLVSSGETIHSIALKCGLSEEDLHNYNGIRSVKEGDYIYIPNLYEVVDNKTNEVSYNFAVCKGIDISDYQDTINWDRVKETSDYVIVEVARIKSDSYLDTVSNHIENVLNNNIDLGLYMCLGGNLETDVVLERARNYLIKLDSELNEKGITIDKTCTPIFIDFELDDMSIDYYNICTKFRELCNEYGYTKVGVYGNSSTLSCIVKSFDNNDSSLNESDLYVWAAGGPNYKDESKWTNKGFKINELEEVTQNRNSSYEVDIQQVTNVCIDTGASNSAGHCDVSFLYNTDLFGDEAEEEYTEYMEVDLNKYSNVPVETVIHGVQNSLTFFTALGYTVLFAKIIGKKLILSIKKRKLVNDEIKKELKK